MYITVDTLSKLMEKRKTYIVKRQKYNFKNTK